MKGIKWGTVALYIVTFGGLLYLFVPLVTIAVFTFNDPTTKFNTTWEGFTWDNWLHPFKEKAFTDALIESLKVAFVACTVATVLGSLIALALVRWREVDEPGAVTAPLVLALGLLLPRLPRWAALATEPGPGWTDAHLRWAVVLVLAVAAGAAAVSDPGRGRMSLPRHPRRAWASSSL